MDGDKLAPPPKTVDQSSAPSILSWIVGQEPPPFEKGNTAAVELALALASAQARPASPRPVSRAVAVQIYYLFCDGKRPTSCRNCTFKDVRQALSGLHFGASTPEVPQALLPSQALLKRAHPQVCRARPQLPRAPQYWWALVRGPIDPK